MEISLEPGTAVARTGGAVIVPALVHTVAAVPAPKAKIVVQVRQHMRMRHLSRRTERQYVHWLKRFVWFCGTRHPGEVGEAEVRSFLSDLAVRAQVSASTQNQARAALVYVYRHVIARPLPWLDEVVAAKPGKRVRVVLEREEVIAVLRELRGRARLGGELLYGAGLRLSELLSLRVHDLDFAGRQILVRGGKGNKDRYTILPARLVPPLRAHLDRLRVRWRRDAERESPVAVVLPEGLDRKYPNASGEWGWQWVFAAARPFWDGAAWRRWHLHPTVLQREVREAVRRSGVAKPASCHTFRHSFATHALQDGVDVRTVQELLGHVSLATTQTYLHVLNRRVAIRSPLDGLDL